MHRWIPLAFVLAASTARADTPNPDATAKADGVDFIADAKLLYRVAACGGTDAVDEKLTKIVERHCKAINDKLAPFKKQYFEKGRTWFDSVVPKDVPKTVVYPFGGGDLISALVAFPDATDITTISLELAGDPRRLKTLTPNAVQMSLGGLRAEIGGLISVGSNTSENLSAGQRNDLPAQVSSFLIALVAGGYEPVALKYFTIDDAGDLHYVTQDDIDKSDAEAKIKAAKEAKAAKLDPEYKASSHLKADWQSPNFALAFSNVEIRYRKIGDSQIRVHRHIAWNLGDAYMKKHTQLLRFLEKKGQATMLVKGASYLLWHTDFSLIRGYLLDHLAWMLSDSTGIPPQWAKPAGMIQETYGRFDGAFLEGSQALKGNEDMVALWKSQKKRPLPFRFGYVDMNKQAHLLVTRPRTH